MRHRSKSSGMGVVASHIARETPNPAPAKVVEVVQAGLDFAELEALREQLDLPLDRLARLLGPGLPLFGRVENARRWVKSPQRGLGGAVPLDYAQTEAGAREVE